MPPAVAVAPVVKKRERRVAKAAKKKPATKKSKALAVKEKEAKQLVIKRERFCQNYIRNREMFGNATMAYAEAYGYNFEEMSTESPVTATDAEGKATEWGDSERVKAEHVCAVSGRKLLRNAEINERITELLNEIGSNDNIDAELSFVANQRSELTPKIAAIKEINAVRGRVRQAVDHTHKFIGVLKHVYGAADKLKDGPIKE